MALKEIFFLVMLFVIAMTFFYMLLIVIFSGSKLGGYDIKKSSSFTDFNQFNDRKDIKPSDNAAHYYNCTFNLREQKNILIPRGKDFMGDNLLCSGREMNQNTFSEQNLPVLTSGHNNVPQLNKNLFMNTYCLKEEKRQINNIQVTYQSIIGYAVFNSRGEKLTLY